MRIGSSNCDVVTFSGSGPCPATLGDLIQSFNEVGVKDILDLRGYFDTTCVFQNGADTDVYLYGAFAFRIEGVVAAAIDDTYFMFQ
jgi:hypothetical protein